MASLPGVDYSFSRPDPKALAQAGYRFVCRYLSGDAGKDLSASERDALLAAGLAIVLVWETTANRALGGQAAGAQDGLAAAQQAHSLNVPPQTCLYFAVDFDLQPGGETQAVQQYFMGARDPVHAAGYRIGVYGGLATMQAIGSVDCFWQTLAWSDGKTFSGAHIFQSQINVPFQGSQIDLDTALQPDFGQWPRPDPPPQENEMTQAQAMALARSHFRDLYVSLFHREPNTQQDLDYWASEYAAKLIAGDEVGAEAVDVGFLATPEAQANLKNEAGGQ